MAENGAKPKRQRKSKSTVEQRSDEDRRDRHYIHVARYQLAEGRKDDAVADFKRVKKQIEQQGGSIEAIKLTLQVETTEGLTEFNATVARYADVARWTGIGIQMNLFDEPTRDNPFAQGRKAALRDMPRTPPQELGQFAAQQWMEGHAEGVTARNKVLAEGFTSLGEKAAEVVGGLASAVAPVGDGFPGEAPGPIPPAHVTETDHTAPPQH